MSDTICGVATAIGSAGVAIIRISGSEALAVLKRVFPAVSDFSPRRMYFGNVVSDGEIIDNALAVYFPAPNSYTGEDVCEIQCHGGAYPQKRCLDVVLCAGARPAEAGEFTKRAFLNGKLELTKAEAVMDYISAVSEAGAKASVRAMNGQVHNKIAELQARLENLLAELNALIEYPDEDIELSIELGAELADIYNELMKLADSYKVGRTIKEGVSIAICGKPNVGKSSLLNAITGDEKAIVTHIAGTTRDIVKEYYNIESLPVLFMDTAGIRNADETIEAMGIERSRSALEKCDIALIVLDGSAPLTAEDNEVLEISRDKSRIIVLNKSDIFDGANEQLFDLKNENARVAKVSCKTGEGIDSLLREIKELAIGDESILEGVVISSERHYFAIREACKAIADAQSSIENELMADCTLIDLKNAWEQLGLITGNCIDENIVDRIFEKFCLGK